MNLRSTLIALPLVALLALPACEEKKPPAPPPPPPPPPKVEAPPPPKPVDIATVLQQARADARVQFPKDHAPVDRTLAEAVIQLASALAKGDEKALAPLLAPGAKSVLESLTKSGDWARGTKGIEAVRIVSLSAKSEDKPTTSNLGLAIQMPGEAFLLGWTATKAGNTWTFKNAWADAGTKTRASEFDGGKIDEGPSASTGSEDHPTPDQLAIVILLTHDLLAVVGQRMGGKLDEQMQNRILTRALQKSEGSKHTVAELMEKARGLVKDGRAGTILSPKEMREFVDFGVDTLAALPQRMTKDDIFESIAKTLKLTKEQIAKMYEQGAGARAPGERPSPAKAPEPAPSRSGGD